MHAQAVHTRPLSPIFLTSMGIRLKPHPQFVLVIQTKQELGTSKPANAESCPALSVVWFGDCSVSVCLKIFIDLSSSMAKTGINL